MRGQYKFPKMSDILTFPLVKCLGRIEADVTGIYVVYQDICVLYVGMSLRVDQRLSYIQTLHHQLPSILTKHPTARVGIVEFPWWELAGGDPTKWVVVDVLRDFEAAAIQHYRPLYNRLAGRSAMPYF